MARIRLFVVLGLVLLPLPAMAQKVGTAGGKGRMIYWLSPDTMEKGEVAFAPNVAWAYVDESGPAGKRIHVLLTESDAPLREWSSAKDRREARRQWCRERKGPFVDLELNDKGGVELLHECANGHFATEMISTINGLDSVVVALDIFTPKQVKGAVRGGEGTCGENVYCDQTEDYVFDAPLN